MLYGEVQCRTSIVQRLGRLTRGNRLSGATLRRVEIESGKGGVLAQGQQTWCLHPHFGASIAVRLFAIVLVTNRQTGAHFLICHQAHVTLSRKYVKTTLNNTRRE